VIPFTLSRRSDHHHIFERPFVTNHIQFNLQIFTQDAFTKVKRGRQTKLKIL
jgi:hypothetical protein